MRNIALIVVDVQNDFCPGGSSSVPDGDQIVESINGVMAYAKQSGMLIIASRHWHPRQIKYSDMDGGSWPVHCVLGTVGAQFHPKLKLEEGFFIISKGMSDQNEGYSAFGGFTSDRIALLELLKAKNIERVYIVGLATDYCVKATAVDAVMFEFDTYLLLDACRAVNIKVNDGAKAIEDMRLAGVKIVSTGKFLSL